MAPGELFYQGAERHIPELLAHLRRQMKFEHDAIHVLGTSNGGRLAFRVGENDRGWLEGSRDVKKRLEALGARVALDVLPDKGHFIYQGDPGVPVL